MHARRSPILPRPSIVPPACPWHPNPLQRLYRLSKSLSKALFRSHNHLAPLNPPPFLRPHNQHPLPPHPPPPHPLLHRLAAVHRAGQRLRRLLHFKALRMRTAQTMCSLQHRLYSSPMQRHFLPRHASTWVPCAHLPTFVVHRGRHRHRRRSGRLHWRTARRSTPLPKSSGTQCRTYVRFQQKHRSMESQRLYHQRRGGCPL